MIRSIGIDSIEIKRFSHWSLYKKETLLKVFSPQEISYCLSIPAKTAERFAVRFAAKEAFLKAFSAILPSNGSFSLLTICKNVSIAHNNQKAPYLNILWDNLWEKSESAPEQLSAYISLTHTKTIATAFIILEKDKNAEFHAIL